MKNETRTILEKLKDIESTEGPGAITEDTITEVCEAHGTTFDEFRSHILEILVDEVGISADELESLSFEKISEKDFDGVFGGVRLPDGVKRGAASLTALLNLSG